MREPLSCMERRNLEDALWILFRLKQKCQEDIFAWSVLSDAISHLLNPGEISCFGDPRFPSIEILTFYGLDRRRDKCTG